MRRSNDAIADVYALSTVAFRAHLMQTSSHAGACHGGHGRRVCCPEAATPPDSATDNEMTDRILDTAYLRRGNALSPEGYARVPPAHAFSPTRADVPRRGARVWLRSRAADSRVLRRPGRSGTVSFYSIINKLSDDRLIWEQENDGGDTRRRCYAITAFGATVLSAEADRLTAQSAATRKLGLSPADSCGGGRSTWFTQLCRAGPRLPPAAFRRRYGLEAADLERRRVAERRGWKRTRRAAENSAISPAPLASVGESPTPAAPAHARPGGRRLHRAVRVCAPQSFPGMRATDGEDLGEARDARVKITSATSHGRREAIVNPICMS
jgi:hypothetical protein